MPQCGPKNTTKDKQTKKRAYLKKKKKKSPQKVFISNVKHSKMLSKNRKYIYIGNSN